MFTIFVVPTREFSPSPSPSSCPHKFAKTNGNDTENHPRCLRRQTRPRRPVSVPRPSTHSLIDSLQNSIFFGGLGSLSREVEAMERQLAAEALAKASIKDKPLSLSSIPSGDPASTLTVTTAASAPEHGLWSRISNMFQSETGAVPLKRYKVTVEELSDSVEQSSRTGKEPAVTTTTAVMPPGLMDWLLQMTREDQSVTAVQLEVGQDNATLQPIEELPDMTSENSTIKNNLDAAHSAPFPSSPQDSQASSDVVANHDLSAAVAVSTAAIMASNAANASAQSTKSQEKENVVSPVLVNKIKDTQETKSHAARENGNAEILTETTEITQRNWPPRRRPLSRNESYTETIITRPDGTRESKTVTVNRETGASETRTRVEYADGSIKESIQSPNGSTWTTIRQRKQQQQQQQQQQQAQVQEPATINTTEDDIELGSHRQSLRDRLAQRRQERAERRKEKQERRKELREAEARQREMTAAAYGFGPGSATTEGAGYDRNDIKAQESDKRGMNGEEDPHGARVEFHRFHDPHYRNIWHQRREERERMSEKQQKQQQQQQQQQKQQQQQQQGERLRRDENGKGEDGEQVLYSKSRTWPPRGYLRRMEKEQEQEYEPRHNV